MLRVLRVFRGLFSFVFLLPASALAIPDPLPLSPDLQIIDALDYPDPSAARQRWEPMGKTPPVRPVKLGGQSVLQMPCLLKSSDIERASWDLKIDLDLTRCQGIQFDLFCEDLSPLSGFSLYFKMDAGWYHANFPVADTGQWQTIRVNKSKTRSEDVPSGWSRITALRFSAWKAQDKDTELVLCHLGLYGQAPKVAVIREETGMKDTGAENICEYAHTVCSSLEAAGISHTLVSDLDAARGCLKGKSLAILPYNPSPPATLLQDLNAFLDAGGKLIAFYVLPEGLEARMGFQPLKHVKEGYPGQFSSIRPQGDLLPGLPPVTRQRSWNILNAAPIDKRSQIAALWFDEAGRSTGIPALLCSDNALFMTHVLLPDDPANKKAFMLALVSRFLPEVQAPGTERLIEEICRIGSMKHFEEGVVAIVDNSGENLLDRIEEMRADYQEAFALCRKSRYSASIAKAREVRDLLEELYCIVQKSAAGEHRAFWCHDAFGVNGLTWDQAIRTLADNGFTAILPNMCWGGTAYYESKVLPVSPTVRDKGDQIAQCLAACRQYGIQCHVWKVNWNTGGHASSAFIDQMKKDGRVQVRFDGSTQSQWLCPSDPRNQQLEIDAMIEVATTYDVDGIHFDYIRYPDEGACFCPGCRKRFEALVGSRVASWPQDLKKTGPLKDKWLQFRRDNITTVVREVSEAARAKKPKIKISAAVFTNWPTDRDTIGQDWKLWCERNYLDFVCPMDYTSDNAAFERQVGLQKGWAGQVPCYPGIGLSVWGAEGDIGKLIEQILVTRKLKTGGFTIFNYSPTEAQDILPLLGKGITKPLRSGKAYIEIN